MTKKHLTKLHKRKYNYLKQYLQQELLKLIEFNIILLYNININFSINNSKNTGWISIKAKKKY